MQKTENDLQKQTDETYRDESTAVSFEEIATIDASNNTVYDYAMVEKPPLFI